MSLKTNRSKLTIALVDSDGGGGSDRADSVQRVEARQNGGRETDEIAGRHGSVVVVVVVSVVVDSVLTPRILKEKWRKKPKSEKVKQEGDNDVSNSSEKERERERW